MNIPVPAGTGDAAWLRAFHAVVPGVVKAFRPDVLVTQQGADSHADDPLADLNLSVDGQRASYRALRELAETVAGGRWLALGGGGYSLVRVVPRAWTHLLATVADRDVDPLHPAADGLAGARRRGAARTPTAVVDVRRPPGGLRAVGRRSRCAGRLGHRRGPQPRVSRCTVSTRSIRVTDVVSGHLSAALGGRRPADRRRCRSPAPVRPDRRPGHPGHAHPDERPHPLPALFPGGVADLARPARDLHQRRPRQRRRPGSRTRG